MPDFKQYLRQHLRLPGVPGTREAEVLEELALELEERYERALRLGMKPEEAWADIAQQVPDWDELSRRLSSVLTERPAPAPEPARPANPVANWLADIRFACRLLRKNRGFAWSVVLVVALGIGLNTAMFSAIYSVFWAPAPWDGHGQMAVLWSRSRDGKFHWKGTVEASDRTRIHVSPRDYAEWKRHSTSFQAFGASTHSIMTLNDDSDRPERVETQLLTPGFLTMQGRKFALGRDFLPGEGTPGGRHVVILSDPAWRRRFGADPRILGKRIWLDGEPYSIVGVTAPAGDAARGIQIWPVLAMTGDPSHQDDRTLTVLALLKRGISIRHAQAEMDVISAGLAEHYPNSDAGLNVSVEPARNNWLSARTGANLWLLMGAVSLILLIACANVANLLLARGAARQKEIAVRVSLGARRLRIFQQLLTESLVLSTLGGTAGTALAWVILKIFLAIIPPDSVPADTTISLSLPALLFAAAITIVAGCIFGCAPAWRATRVDVNRSLKQMSDVGHTRRGHRLLKSLVVAEFALTLTLLCTAGLSLRTFWARLHLDLGIRTDHLLTFEVPLRKDLFPSSDQILPFYRQLIARLRAIPEVVNAAAVNTAPLGDIGALPFAVTGNPPLTNSLTPPPVGFRSATPGFFDTVGARLNRGRNLDEHDLRDGPKVALVNEKFAREFLPGRDPLRQVLTIPLTQPPMKFQIVGVFHDMQNAPQFGKENVPEIYVSFNQVPLRAMTVVVSSALDPDLLRNDAATALHSLNPSLPMANVRTVEQIASGRLAFERFEAAVYGCFAGLALLLATVGMYGVVAFFVTQRTREIGVRVALGATPSDIVELILTQGLTLAVAGLILGTGCAWWASRWMQSTLYGAGSPSATVMATVGTLLLATALLASLIPAQRAAVVDPAATLRGE